MRYRRQRPLYDLDRNGQTTVREATNITPYLSVGEDVVVEGQRKSISGLPDMSFLATCPVDGESFVIGG